MNDGKAKTVIYNGSSAGLLHLCLNWLKEVNSTELGIEVNVKNALNDIQTYIDGIDSDIVVLELDGEMIGFIGIRLFASPVGNQIMANEHYWYVLPEHRRFGLKLLQAIKKWSSDRNCTHLITSASNLASSLHDRVCKLYKKTGMSLFETSYIMRL